MSLVSEKNVATIKGTSHMGEYSWPCPKLTIKTENLTAHYLYL